MNANLSTGSRSRRLTSFRSGPVTLLLLCLAGVLHGQTSRLDLPGESFEIDGRPAFLWLPSPEKRSTPQPWILYAPTLPAYPDHHEKWMHEQFLAAGIAVAGIDVGEAYGSPAGCQHLDALYRTVTDKYQLAARPCLLGRSRGGLWVSSWAIRHPDRVSGIAGIYPVFDLRSYPGLERAAPAFGLSPEELSRSLTEYNPVANAAVLAKAKIPICIIHGDDDQVVPLKENSAALAEIYQTEGAAESIELIIANGQGHNFWQGFFQCQTLVDFAIARARAGVDRAMDR